MTPIDQAKIEEIRKRLIDVRRGGDPAISLLADLPFLIESLEASMKENEELKQCVELANQRAELTKAITEGAVANVNEIRRLRTENERLRGALSLIAYHEWTVSCTIRLCGRDMTNIARQALASHPEPTRTEEPKGGKE